MREIGCPSNVHVNAECFIKTLKTELVSYIIMAKKKCSGLLWFLKFSNGLGILLLSISAWRRESCKKHS